MLKLIFNHSLSLVTNIFEILIEIQTFSCKKMSLKMFFIEGALETTCIILVFVQW